jgi:GntR family transcriptional regulator of gluconate operon
MAEKVFPIKNEALGDRIARELRHQIIVGKLAVGQHLVEEAVAEMYTVSRGPVRDAFRQISYEGFIEPQKRGFRVVGLSKSDIDEIYSLRQAIETLAVRQAIAQQPDWSEARAHVEGMREAAANRDPQQFAELDIKFHRSFYQEARNRRLLEVWNLQERTLTALLEVNPHENDDLTAAAEAHSRLLDAIVADSPLWPGYLMEHLMDASSRIKAFYFEKK